MTHHLISIQSQNLDRHPCQLSRFSYVQVFVTPWTVAHQAPLSMGFSRQEDWSGLSCPLSGYLPDPGIEPTSLISPALAGTFSTTSAFGNHSWFCQSHLSFIHSGVFRSPITLQALGQGLEVHQWTCPLVLSTGSGDIRLSWGALESDSQIRNCKHTFHWEELLGDTSKGGKMTGLGRERSWASKQVEMRPQLTLHRALEL